MKTCSFPSWTPLALAALGVLALAGCAHTSENQALDAKVAQTEPKTRAELGQEAKQTIATSPDLSADQKKRLEDLRVATRTKIDALTGESQRLRTILVEDVLATDDRHDEVKRVQNRMRKVESKRLNAMFDAVDEANLILGREARSNTPYFEEFLGSRDMRQ